MTYDNQPATSSDASLMKSDLLAQFDEFFSIHTQFNVNVNPLPAGDNINFTDFCDQMPLPFKMASEVSTLDQAALSPLQNVSAVTEQLMQYLHYQNQKIDLLVSYIVNQQDQEQNRYQGTQLGGGGIIFISPNPLKLDHILELKIFLSSENTAIYCHGQIAEIEHNQQGYAHKVVFRHIRDQDRETLVRASLHLQARQLKELANKRNQAKQV